MVRDETNQTSPEELENALLRYSILLEVRTLQVGQQAGAINNDGLVHVALTGVEKAEVASGMYQ
jgi:hypothetical protein